MPRFCGDLWRQEASTNMQKFHGKTHGFNRVYPIKPVDDDG